MYIVLSLAITAPYHYGTSMAFLTSLKDVIQALLYYYSFEWRS